MNVRVIPHFCLLLSTILGAFLTTSAIGQSQSPPPSYLVQVGVADSVYSEVLDESRDLWIHLPNGGDLLEGHEYPVVYLLDGGVHLGGLAMIQEYYNFFRLPEMIVVAISNRTNRTRDLTTSEVDSRQGNMVAESGGAERFTQFISDELIPYVESKYPVSSYRTLIGHSYAGLFTINTLIHHKELFKNYIAIDPSLSWDDQRFLDEATEALETDSFSGKGLYVSMANELLRFTDTMTIDDVMHDTTEFSLSVRSILEFVHTAEAKKSNGLQFAWDYYDKDLHGSVPLISMRDGLVFLFDWWELKTPSRYNDPATSVEEITDLINERTRVLTENIGQPMAMEEELMTMLGFMAMQMDQPVKAKTVFDLVLKYYPNSAAAHDAMVDFYVSQDDRENALIHARHAFSISGSDAHAERIRELSS
jgi:predicted alpha/beta superfamily hydrolase